MIDTKDKLSFGYLPDLSNKHINKEKRGNILQSNEDIDLSLRRMISNNDYLMIKGSNATGLYDFSKKMIKGI